MNNIDLDEVTNVYIVDMLEEKLGYHKYVDKMPYLKINSDWQIKVIPPFGGAMVRYRIRRKDVEVSVYLDCHSMLGSTSTPYWEMYPTEDGDAVRWDMDDIDGLYMGMLCSLYGVTYPPREELEEWFKEHPMPENDVLFMLTFGGSD